MNRVLIYLGRFAIDIAGYAIAALVASLVLHILALPQFGLSDVQPGSVTAAVLLVWIPFVALFIAYFAFLPSLVAIAIAEVMGLRSWLYHALAGGVIGLVLTMLYRSSVDADFLEVGSGLELIPPGYSIHDPAFLATVVGAGMFAGIAFWAVAGRSAGLWLEQAAAQRPGRPESQ